MSHDANPTGREPAEGHAGAGSPWVSAPDSDEPRATDGNGPARARASVPPARGSASVQPSAPRPAMDEREGWQAPSDEQPNRPGPYPPAGPTPQGYLTPPPPPAGGPMTPRAAGAAQVPGAHPSGPAQTSPASGYGQVPPPHGPAQVSPAAGGYPGFPPGAQPPQAYGAPGQEYGHVTQPINRGQDYGQPTQTFNPAQEYGQPTQAFNPNQPYGQPSEGYAPQSPAGYPAPQFEPQREMPTGVYGASAQGYPPQAYGDAPQAYGDPMSTERGDDAYASEPEGKNKRLLLILALVAAIVVLAAVGTAVTLAVRGSTVDYAVNDCVKQSGSQAVKASCSDSGAYKVVNKVKQQSECPDPNQPFVLVSHNGGGQDVLCLRPTSQK